MQPILASASASVTTKENVFVILKPVHADAFPAVADAFPPPSDAEAEASSDQKI